MSSLGMGGKGSVATMSIEPVTASEGWGVLHLFFHLRHDLIEDRQLAAKDFCARLSAFASREDYQVLAFSVLGQKADLGLMLLGPDLARLDAFSAELATSPLGAALLPAASYVSLTELSEYTATEQDEAARLVAEEGVAEGTAEHSAALEAFRTRMADYERHRLHPRLPERRCISFYPMSKRRSGDDNWYALDFAERKRLMGGHARVGRSYRGRVLQLITGSVGLDDWEWGVTLLADDPKALRDIVYEMRFDEVSARYGEFGPFVTGLVLPPADLLAQLGIT
jgi:peroxiredoxin